MAPKPLDNFPHHEYGEVRGVISKIRPIPIANVDTKEMEYQAWVALPSGLESTYGRELEYLPEMGGTARIITEDLRLIDRVFSQFRRVLDQE